MIYEDRPFSCRRIYSAHVCSQDAPRPVSRQVEEIMEFGKAHRIVINPMMG
ncbi:MAG: hypothetical protein PHG14_16060 [Desulfobacter postgatei]|uniref:hypothetical protein n=1 Tax=Desulfobacter postgatei TaxID=2293 RepID=UPI0023F48F26|nr:hypothetical protein [Desulfobacter postgatei]MDD4275226.1 hypothetical protein [Desulfobacter postgatei]